MKYNQYIAAMVNRDENSLFGLIPVMDECMKDYIVSAIRLFENMMQTKYGVGKSDAAAEIIDYNSITYNAILSYGDRSTWNFEHTSEQLAKAFVQILVQEDKYNAAYKIMKYINGED